MNRKIKRNMIGCTCFIILSGLCILWNHKPAKGSPSEVGQKDAVAIVQPPNTAQLPEVSDLPKEESAVLPSELPNTTPPAQETSSSKTETPKEDRPIADLPFNEDELIERGFVKTEIGSLRNPYDPGSGYTILLVKDFWQEQDAENWMQEQISRTPEFANPFGDYRNYISENQDGSWSAYISKKGRE